MHVWNTKSKTTPKWPILEIPKTTKSYFSKTWREKREYMIDIMIQPSLFVLFNIKVKRFVHLFKIDVLFLIIIWYTSRIEITWSLKSYFYTFCFSLYMEVTCFIYVFHLLYRVKRTYLIKPLLILFSIKDKKLYCETL